MIDTSWLWCLVAFVHDLRLDLSTLALQMINTSWLWYVMDLAHDLHLDPSTLALQIAIIRSRRSQDRNVKT
jgi:hypothetical protein